VEVEEHDTVPILTVEMGPFFSNFPKRVMLTTRLEAVLRDEVDCERLTMF